jgi:hypothetical protein
MGDAVAAGPKLTVPVISSIAGASLFIYLTHFQFSTLGSKLYGNHPLAHLLLAIAGGILVWRVYDWGARQLSGAKARRGDKASAAAV